MVQPLGSFQSPTPFPVPGASGGLQVQLDQARKQLSDCVSCDTANTTEGRAQIQVLTARVKGLETRIQEAQQARQRQETPQPAVPPGLSAGAVGGQLDVSA